jgi:hypothetical protein
METGGKLGYRLSGKSTVIDNQGRSWGSWGGPSDRGSIKVSAGGTERHNDWVSSRDHSLCNGLVEYTWTGQDAGGHPIQVTVKIRLRHLGCPGKKT